MTSSELPLNSDGGGDIVLPLEFSDQQLLVLKVLSGRHPELASMYLGALRVFSDEGNVDRFALAAHGLRELIEKIPKYYDVPIGSQLELKNRIYDLSTAWEAEPANRNSGSESELSVGFRDQLRDFFNWFGIPRRNRRQEALDFFNKLDPKHGVLPEPIQKARIDEWNKCKGFFIKVSHHEDRTTREEFLVHEKVLSRILIDLARPRTFENADILDAIIKEGETNG